MDWIETGDIPFNPFFFVQQNLVFRDSGLSFFIPIVSPDCMTYLTDIPDVDFVSEAPALLPFLPACLPGIRERVRVAYDKAHNQGDSHCRDECFFKNDGNDQGKGDRTPEEGDTDPRNDTDQADRERDEWKEPENEDSEGSPNEEAREDVSPGKPC
jgi:hypothetical protein